MSATQNFDNLFNLRVKNIKFLEIILFLQSEAKCKTKHGKWLKI